MKKIPKKEELLEQFYTKESRAESVKRRLKGIGKRIPIVPILVVLMLLTVVGLSGVLVSEADLEFRFSSKDYSLMSPAGWSDDQRLTDNSYTDETPAVDVEGDKVHITWDSRNNVNYMNSSDAGLTWSSSAMLSRPNGNNISENPDIGVYNDNVHIVWNRYKSGAPAEQNEIYYRNSTDGGLSWNDRQRLSEDDGYHSVGPYLSVEKDNLHLIWTDERHSSTEVYYLRSIDGGISWDNGTGGQYGRRLTTTSGDTPAEGVVKEGNTVHVLYSDRTDGDFDIFYKASYDKGVTWQSGIEIAESSTTYGPGAIAVNGSTVHVVWVEYDGSDYYIWYRNSTNNGQNWNVASRLVGPSPSAWAPELTCNESHVYMVWNDQRDDGTHSEVYIMNSTNSGGDWGTEKRLTEVDNEHSGGPKIDLTDGIKYIVWEDERDGNDEIYFKRSPGFISVPEFSNLLLPVILMILTYMTVWRYRVWRKKNGDK